MRGNCVPRRINPQSNIHIMRECYWILVPHSGQMPLIFPRRSYRQLAQFPLSIDSLCVLRTIVATANGARATQRGIVIRLLLHSGSQCDLPPSFNRLTSQSAVYVEGYDSGCNVSSLAGWNMTEPRMTARMLPRPHRTAP